MADSKSTRVGCDRAGHQHCLMNLFNWQEVFFELPGRLLLMQILARSENF